MPHALLYPLRSPCEHGLRRAAGRDVPEHRRPVPRRRQSDHRRGYREPRRLRAPDGARGPLRCSDLGVGRARAGDRLDAGRDGAGRTRQPAHRCGDGPPLGAGTREPPDGPSQAARASYARARGEHRYASRGDPRRSARREQLRRAGGAGRRGGRANRTLRRAFHELWRDRAVPVGRGHRSEPRGGRGQPRSLGHSLLPADAAHGQQPLRRRRAEDPARRDHRGGRRDAAPDAGSRRADRVAPEDGGAHAPRRSFAQRHGGGHGQGVPQ